MNRLQQKAKNDLKMYFFNLIFSVFTFYFLLQQQSNEPNLLIIVLAVIFGIWIPVGQFVMKRRMLKGLDERERLIYEKAKMISDSIFGGLFLIGLFGLWGWLGPKTTIPVFVPVVMFLGLAFIAAITQPLIILIQCKMEQGNE